MSRPVMKMTNINLPICENDKTQNRRFQVDTGEYPSNDY